MQLTIEQQLILNLYQPLDAAAYLRTNGWTLVKLEKDKYGIWTKTTATGEDFELLLPMAVQYIDFPKRVLELLDILVAQERRAGSEIVEDITTPNADINRIRLPFEDDFVGTVPLAKSQDLFQHIKDLMLASASAAVAPCKAFSNRPKDMVRAYLNDARIGRTKGGSFIVTIFSPIPPQMDLPNGQMPLIAADDMPFQRKVMLTFAEAIVATNDGLRKLIEEGSEDGFGDLGIAKGISANLCDALCGLQQVCDEGRLEFSFSWATRSPIPADPIRKADIPPGSSVLLKNMAEKLKETAAIIDVEIVGVPKKAVSTGIEEDTFTIDGVVDGDRKRVVVSLSGTSRHEAIKAYESRRKVMCRGDLVRDGKSYYLINPRNFSIIPTSDDNALEFDFD